MKVGCISQGIWPQCKVDCLWPAGAHMEQLLLCAFREVPDGLLGDAILKVGIDPTEGELLPCVVVGLLEGIVMEAFVVAVRINDLESMFCSVLHKGSFAASALSELSLSWRWTKLEAAEVVNKDSGALVALLGKFALQLCIKTHFH